MEDFSLWSAQFPKSLSPSMNFFVGCAANHSLYQCLFSYNLQSYIDSSACQLHEYQIGTVPKLKAVFIILLVGTVFKVVSKRQTHSKKLNYSTFFGRENRPKGHRMGLTQWISIGTNCVFYWIEIYRILQFSFL